MSQKYGLLIRIYAKGENLRTGEKTSIVIIKVSKTKYQGVYIIEYVYFKAVDNTAK